MECERDASEPGLDVALALQELRRLQAMVHAHTAQTERHHVEIKNLILGDTTNAGVRRSSHADSDVLSAQSLASSDGTRYICDNLVEEFSGDQDAKDRRKRVISADYLDLEHRSRRNRVSRLMKDADLNRQHLHAFFSKRYLHCDALYRLVNSTPFITFFSVVILLNALVMGIVVEVEIGEALGRGPLDSLDARRFLRITEIGFTSLFALELSLRIAAFELSFFFADDWKFNWLDFVLVLSTIEFFWEESATQLTYLRILRLFRLVRTLRVVREVPFFAKLRTMINAIANSVASLFWALVLSAFAMFLFGCIFLQGATQYVRTHVRDDANVSFLEQFFSSVPVTMLTLFMSITSGVSWWEVADVLWDIGVVYAMLFVLYIACMYLALLNIVTGIFVNDALEMGGMDHDLRTQIEGQKRMRMVEELRQVFARLDTDQSGTVSKQEFSVFMDDPAGPALFSMYGLHVTDAIAVFEALDVDDNCELDIDEFVMGCMQLGGNAKTVDMLTRLRDNKKVMLKIASAHKAIEVEVRELRRMVGRLLSDDTPVALRPLPEPGDEPVTHASTSTGTWGV